MTLKYDLDSTYQTIFLSNFNYEFVAMDEDEVEKVKDPIVGDYVQIDEVD